MRLNNLYLYSPLIALLAASHLTANAAVAIQGKNYVCKDASYMQLWDSASSQLVKHQMLLDENCWKPMKGIHVDVLEQIGKFSRIRYSGNGIIAYAYSDDLKIVQSAPVEPAKATIGRTFDKIKRVDSLTEQKEVMLLDGRPTVNLTLTANGDTTMVLTIVKEVLKTGFKVRAENQRNGTFQVSIRHKNLRGGFGSPDHIEIEILERNDPKNYMEMRVSGYINKFDREKNKDLEFKPATIRISGANFLEVIRSHTAQELTKPFRDAYGRTT